MRSIAEDSLSSLLIAVNDPKQKSHQIQYLSGNFKGHRQDVPQYRGEECWDEHGMNCAVLGKSQNSESHETNCESRPPRDVLRESEQ